VVAVGGGLLAGWCANGGEVGGREKLSVSFLGFSCSSVLKVVSGC
jgi:hypothetical protein